MDPVKSEPTLLSDFLEQHKDRAPTLTFAKENNIRPLLLNSIYLIDKYTALLEMDMRETSKGHQRNKNNERKRKICTYIPLVA